MDAIATYLAGKGFRPVWSPDNNIPIFQGIVIVELCKITLEYRFIRKELGEPEVYVIDWPMNKELRNKLGSFNINNQGRICHTDETQSVWDAAIAVRHVAGVFEKIFHLLERNIKGDANPADIAADFSAYWSANETVYLSEPLIGKTIYQSRKRSNIRWLTYEEKPTEWITNSQDKDQLLSPWLYITLKHFPTPIANNFPPKHTGHFFSWLFKFDPISANNISQLIKEKILSNKAKHKRGFIPERLYIIFSWMEPRTQITDMLAISFKPDINLKTSILQGRVNGVRALLSQSALPLTRYDIKRADPNYLHNRCIPKGDTNLKNLKILQIGAGAIGGYLASMLCSLGAGLGTHGKLLIIDKDNLTPENIGRHQLGINSLGEPKASAIAKELLGKFPHLSIISEYTCLFKKTELIQGHDLIINATGSQTTGFSLETLISTLPTEKQPPIIHSWIHGQGLATLTFIKQTPKDACFRCLWQIINDEYEFRYPISKEPTQDEQVFGGCHGSYHPYIVSAATIAASNTINMINDWVNIRVKETLKFTYLQMDKCQIRKDTTPDKLKQCPNCQRL